MTAKTSTPNEKSSYPYKNTRAAIVLSRAIDAKSPGTSLREMAGLLGYRSAVVLSHMRTGRLPIPVDRARDIAEMVGLNEQEFLMAVLEQRYPRIDFTSALDTRKRAREAETKCDTGLAAELATLSGRSLDDLEPECVGVLREVVSDRHPRRRWLSVAEAGLIDVVRTARPDLARDGLTAGQAAALAKALNTMT